MQATPLSADEEEEIAEVFALIDAVGRGGVRLTGIWPGGLC